MFGKEKEINWQGLKASCNKKKIVEPLKYSTVCQGLNTLQINLCVASHPAKTIAIATQPSKQRLQIKYHRKELLTHQSARDRNTGD